MPEKRACIFCGATPLSAEHLFPQWVTKALETKGLTGTGHARGSSKQGTIHEWQEKRPLQYVVKAVCRDCNNGWMGPLIEEAAAVYLQPMMIGQFHPLNPCELDQEATRTIAAWVALRALIFWHMHKELPPIPARWINQFRDHKTIPEGWTVWLGAQKGSIPAFLEVTSEIIAKREGALEQHQGLMVTGIMGHLVFKVFAFIDTHNPVGYSCPNAIVRIFPTPDLPLCWPPKGIMDDASLPHFFDHGGVGSASGIWEILKKRQSPSVTV